MIELNVFIQFIQAVGISGFVVVTLLAIWFYRERGGYASSKADADQQAVVSKIALTWQERGAQLEDERYHSLKQNYKLLMRVQLLEAQLMRLPVVEAEVFRLKKELAQTRQERDDLKEALREKEIAEAKLLGRIEALEAHIIKLEAMIRSLTNETDIPHIDDELDIDRTNPLYHTGQLRSGRDGRADGDTDDGNGGGDPAG